MPRFINNMLVIRVRQKTICPGEDNHYIPQARRIDDATIKIGQVLPDCC
jgi:hypothetical protein